MFALYDSIRFKGEIRFDLFIRYYGKIIFPIVSYNSIILHRNYEDSHSLQNRQSTETKL